MEINEIKKHQDTINLKVEKEQEKLYKLQQLQVQNLLKRIERDRNEQIKHREHDSKILLQRNKNVMADIIERQ